jgi:hypothetical protein
MLDKIEYLEDGYKKYPMAFTFNVMEAIQVQYGTLEEWSKLAQSGNEPNIKALKFMLTQAINEGIEITHNGSVAGKLVTSKDVGRLITRVGITTVAEKITKLITDSVSNGEPSKNDKATKNLQD